MTFETDSEKGSHSPCFGRVGSLSLCRGMSTLTYLALAMLSNDVGNGTIGSRRAILKCPAVHSLVPVNTYKHHTALAV